MLMTLILLPEMGIHQRSYFLGFHVSQFSYNQITTSQLVVKDVHFDAPVPLEVLGASSSS